MNQRLTAWRKRVLAAVESSTCPVTAKAIHSQLGGRPDVSTVYRALEFLEGYGLVSSVTLFDGERYFSRADGHEHLIMCSRCHEIKTFDECPAAGLQRTVEQVSGYRITGHVLYFSGLCPVCRGAGDGTAEKEHSDD
jgi:Fur family transcriptional regulator, ferric uptake regulator